MRESRLIKVLKDSKLLSDSKIREAINQKKKLGPDVNLEEVLVKLGFIKQEQINDLYSLVESEPVLDIDKHIVDADAMDKLPRQFLKKHMILPLADEKGKILLAMAEPVDLETVEEIQFMTNRLVETILAPRDKIEKAMSEYDSLPPHERKARTREAAHSLAVEEKPIPNSPHLAEVLAEILVERGLMTREEITARLKTKEL